MIIPVLSSSYVCWAMAVDALHKTICCIRLGLCRNLDMNFRECPECELRLYGVLGSTRAFAGLATMGATAPVRSVGEEKQLCHSLIQTEYASSTMTRARVSL